MKTFRPMPAFNGVAVSSTATLNMPISGAYHAIQLLMGGTTFDETHISEIRLRGDGRELMVFSGADLDTMQQFDGLAGATAALLYLDFERSNLLTKNGRELTAIGTNYPQVLDKNAADYNPTPFSTLQMEVDIAGTAVAPTLSAKALQSGPAPLGMLRKRRRFFRDIAGAGDLEISDLPRGDLIDKIYIKHTGNVTGVKFDTDNFRQFDRTAAENNQIQANGERVPQTNWFVLDPSESGLSGEFIRTDNVNDMRLIVSASAADSISVYVDYIGGPQGN